MIRSVMVAVFLGLYALLLGPPLIVYSLITRSSELIYWTSARWVVFLTRMVGVRVRAEGVENVPAGVCLFAANHTSNMDLPAAMKALPRRLAFLAKKSLFQIPLVGLAFRIANFIPVDRENREAALASVERAVQFIKTGSSFLVFPEGTRSPDGRLGRFKKGSFAMAIETGVPIVPVAFIGAHRVMAKQSLAIHPGEILVRFGEPIATAEISLQGRAELARRVHDAIARLLPADQQPATPMDGP